MIKISLIVFAILIVSFTLTRCVQDRIEVYNFEDEISDSIWDNSPIIINGANYSGILYQKYPNGQLNFEISIQDGIPDGRYRAFHENGQIHQDGYFEYGKQSGRWKTFNSNGTLNNRLSGVYEDGVKVSE